METLALGTKLKLGDGGAPEAFTQVLDARELSGPGISVETEEVTNHSQTHFWRQFKPAVIDPGEVSGVLLWDPSHATHDEATGLLSFLTSRQKRNFKLDWPTDPVHTWAFQGIVTGWEPDTPLDEHLKVAFAIKLSQIITMTKQAIVTAVTDTGADGPAYVTAETIEITVAFDKAVTVTGVPRITLALQSGNVLASFASGDGTANLVFSYVVQGGDSSPAGTFDVPVQTIDLNGGSMVDANGNDVRLLTVAGDFSTVSVN